MTSKRILTWGGFIVVIGLIIWGLIAAEKKSNREQALIALPSQITAIDHVKGSETAPVTLVEYGDFECPACADYYPFVERAYAELGSSTLRVVFRHFPLPNHKNAMPAALASEAAGNQGKFWEMYSLLYEKQRDWSLAANTEEVFAGYAQSLGLDMEKYQADLKDPITAERINLDYKSGVQAKIGGTPTFFVNGKQITNPRNYDELKKVIEDAALAAPRS